MIKKMATENDSEVKEKIRELKMLMEETKGSGFIGDYIAYFHKTRIDPICGADKCKKYESEDVEFLEDILDNTNSGPISTIAGGITAIGNLVVSGNCEGDGYITKDICGQLGWLIQSLGGALEELSNMQNTIYLSMAKRLKEELRKQEGNTPDDEYVGIPISNKTIRA